MYAALKDSALERFKKEFGGILRFKVLRVQGDSYQLDFTDFKEIIQPWFKEDELVISDPEYYYEVKHLRNDDTYFAKSYTRLDYSDIVVCRLEGTTTFEVCEVYDIPDLNDVPYVIYDVVDKLDNPKFIYDLRGE